MVEKEISDEKKEFYYAKNKINLENFQKYDVKSKLEDRVFGPEGGGKLTFKHAVVNEKEFNQIDHHASEHTQQVQRSQYLMIDNNVETLLHQHKGEQNLAKNSYTNQVENLKNVMSSNEKIKLRYKFCKSEDVNQKRQNILVFKSKFLT